MSPSQEPGTAAAGTPEAPVPGAPAADHVGPSARLRVQRVRPAYRQVADDLRGKIMRGAVAAG